MPATVCSKRSVRMRSKNCKRPAEVPRLRDRHLDFYLDRAEEALPKQFEAYQQLRLNWLDNEHDNLRTALTWALESRRIEGRITSRQRPHLILGNPRICAGRCELA